jgi:hypothetical protein
MGLIYGESLLRSLVMAWADRQFISAVACVRAMKRMMLGIGHGFTSSEFRLGRIAEGIFDPPDDIIDVPPEIEVLSQAADSSAGFLWRIQA